MMCVCVCEQEVGKQFHVITVHTGARVSETPASPFTLFSPHYVSAVLTLGEPGRVVVDVAELDGDRGGAG